MINAPLDRFRLKQDAWQRRDTEANTDQVSETRNLETAFRFARILLSGPRLRAEVYLLQN